MTEHHSATVRLWLIVDDQAIRLSHTAGDYVIIASGEHHAPCNTCSGVVIVFVDGAPIVRAVDLPDGIQGERVRVEPRK